MNAKTNDRKYDEVLTGMGYQIEIKYFHNEPYLNASDICRYRDESKADRPAYDLIREFLSNHKTQEFIIEWMDRNLLDAKIKPGAGPSFNEMKRAGRNTNRITATVNV